MSQSDSDNSLDQKEATDYPDANDNIPITHPDNTNSNNLFDYAETPSKSIVLNGVFPAELSPDQQRLDSSAAHDGALANGSSSTDGFAGHNTCLTGNGAIEEENGTVVLSSDSQSSNEGEQDWSSDGFEPDLRRVKVYELVGTRWQDRGTAFCSGDFDENAQEAKLIARSELNPANVILSCTIRANDVYQRQQETLIVWTELDGTDFAMSFQDTEGCAEVWDFIVEVQRHLQNRAGPSVTTQQIIQSGRLPHPEVGIIGEIERAIRSIARSPKAKENICNYIQENSYIHSLIAVFNQAEMSEDLETLHALCSCMQTILLLNEHFMYEHIVTDELWLGVVGILEYDPEFPKHKANYREFHQQRARFLTPIAFDTEIGLVGNIEQKIHYTYRLQYLKDVILGRALDDSTFAVLNSSIIFNQVDIINYFATDHPFVTKLVKLFLEPGAHDDSPKRNEKDSDMEVDKSSLKSSNVNGSDDKTDGLNLDVTDDLARRREVIVLLQQLCAMGKNVQLPARINLFKSLAEHGILHAVQWALCRSEKHLVYTAGEILTTMLEHHTTSVRQHILSQAISLGQPIAQDKIGELKDNEKTAIVKSVPSYKESLGQVMCRIMANSQDFALQNQMSDALRILLDVPPNNPNTDLHAQVPVGPKLLMRPGKDDHTVERFLDNFYKVAAETLFRPLTTEVPIHEDVKSSPFRPAREKGNLYLYLCDLLCSFALQHSFRSFFFILSSNIASRIASLLTVRDKHLCLAALRFFRICLKMNNRNLFGHLHKHGVFKPLVALTIRESKRDNLLSSACQEFFEFMRKEGHKDPINHMMTDHGDQIRELAKSAKGASTYQGFIIRWEILNEPAPKEEEKPKAVTLQPLGSRLMDEEEEDYFNKDEEDEDPVIPVPRANTLVNLPSRRKRLRVSVPGIPISQRGSRPHTVPSQRPVSPLSSLLEYDEDDDPGLRQPEASTSSTLLSPHLLGSDAPTPQSPILPHRQIQILPYEPSDSSDPPGDDVDDILENLVSKKPVQSLFIQSRIPVPSKSSASLEMPPIRSREKRRRRDEEDDEDELLERLANKSRRLSDAGSDEKREVKPKPVITPKITEDGPVKKLKLKLTSTKPSLEPTPISVTGRASAKDGDNG